MTNRNAFTLAELLMVIAIVALVLAILLPVFFNSRNKANAASCLSMTKQIAAAEKMYLSDYDGMYCPDTAVPTITKKWQVTGCPSAGFKERKSPGLPGYGFNGQLHGFQIVGLKPLSEQQVYAPAVTVSMGEIYGEAVLTGWIDPKERGERHADGSNFLFCDGHSKWLRPNEVGSIEDPNDGTKPTFNPERHIPE
ncbi:MAG: hypothetical protein OHK0029_39200 [Armatimonadaceae bacterium]